MTSAKIIVLASTLAATGCTVDTADYLHVSFEGTNAQVNIDCSNGGPGCGVVLLTGVLSLDESNQLPKDATVEIVQYRVDYQLSGVGEQPPPLEAVPGTLVVAKGQSAPYDYRVAEDPQRNAVASQLSGAVGVATLTVIGRDHEGAAAQASTKFEIVFGDYSTQATSSSSSSGGGGAGGGT